ncbi:hypothetical protein NIES932_14460 [Raphidiopsis curvata NIES-932]|nr:hypothetical protein NIES932_14460 [Raphidiopsis curvata NIES-932]
MALVGISIENEFYAPYYVDTLLSKDVDVKSKETEEKPAYELLEKIQQEYFQVRNRVERTTNQQEKYELQSDLIRKLLSILGYEYKIDFKLLDDDRILPIVAEVKKNSGEPYVWILSAFNLGIETSDILSLEINQEQINEINSTYLLNSKVQKGKKSSREPQVVQGNLEELLNDAIFAQNAPPKWVILINMEQIVLIDRYKWNASRLIRFDLAKLLEERDKKSLMVTANLLHRESIVLKDGTCLLDIIEEKSYRHSYSISENLKFALREAIEILGNEAIYYWQKSGKRVFDNQKQKEQGVVEIDPQQLKKECLRWIYRLLFLFYIEARPDLGYIPMGSDVYRQGYSLEALRDVELAKLTEEDEENYYLDWSIRLLFELLWSGYPLDKQKQLTTENPSLADTPIHKTFRLPSLQSHLFDPKNTEMLNEVKFRNVALQKIIRLMSLSTQEGKRGRISYAQLGVNQLGEVYEGLLSLSAFLAQEDLYEVQPWNKKESGDESEEQEEEDLETNERGNVTRGKTVKAKENLKQDLEVAYFIPEHRMDEFKQEELVIDWEKGEFRKHPKGKFLFRLAGRDREKSASYYTPQSLTKCLVKYALKELLEGKQADDILELTICEPAMGSAAFLNEVIDQLAETYLERKQKEKGELISHEQAMREQQKIKMLLADRNVFGIDKNPIAMELAEVSLWLNCIYASEADKDNIFIPWFGFQLQCGNSLIGARRQIYYLNNITEKKKSKSSKNTKWYEQEPEQLSLGKNLPKGGIFHFLLGDPGMANYTDKIIKKMTGENLKKIDNWRKEFCQELTDEQGSYAHTLSERIDKLWHHYAQELKRIRKRTTDSLNIWGQEEEKKQEIALEKKDKIHDQEKLAEGIENATSYRRLKLVMDYWCALWFWPIEKAEELPDREQFFCDLAIILGETEMLLDSNRQLSLFPETQTPQEGEEFINQWGFVNLNKLKQKNIRLQIVDEVVNNQRFFHWELEFADIFWERGGFDLILGNPPWIKMEWKEGGILGDYDPRIAIRNLSASELAKKREELFDRHPGLRAAYIQEYQEISGTKNFLNAEQNYPLLKGSQTNLFKCFLPQGWRYTREGGVSAFLHPEGVYDDPKGGRLRRAIYQRLRYHFQFVNVKKLFQEVMIWVTYSINIYSSKKANTLFESISNLYISKTVDECLEHDGKGEVKGIKDESDKWNVQGHKERIITVNRERLNLFAQLYDEGGTPGEEARLPTLHSQQLIQVLEKFAAQERRLGDLQGEYFATVMFDETNAVKKDQTIKRNTQFAQGAEQLILSGPHFFVGNPLNKTPRKVCRLSSDYDVIDLTQIPPDYLPRTNYVPDCTPRDYLDRTPRVPWGEQKPVTDFYRVVARGMLSQSGERTYISCLVPPHCGHINGVQSVIFKETKVLLNAVSFSISIIADLYIKTTGRSNLHYTWENLPLINGSPSLHIRTLALNCLTQYYGDLWEENWHNEYTQESWSKPQDPRLNNNFFSQLTPFWQRNNALRTDYERRQALLEIDVLAAMSLGMTLDELNTIYRVQFPVMQQKEKNTYYDMNGRIVFTVQKKGSVGVGLPRKGNPKTKSPGWEDIKDMTTGTVEVPIVNQTLSNNPANQSIIYQAPFEKCDRIEDYSKAWDYFRSLD